MAVRAITMLPTIMGAWKQQGGGMTLSTSGTFALNKAALQRPELMTKALGRPARILNMMRLGEVLTDARADASGEGAVRVCVEPGGGVPQP